MTDTVDAVAARGLPDSVTPTLVERLVRLLASSPDATTTSTFTPYSGEKIADLPVATTLDVERVFGQARIAQRSWAATPLRERIAIVLRFHDLVLERQDEALDLMQAENGKSRRDAFLEVADVAMVARYYARTAAKVLGDRGRRGAIIGLTRTIERRQPKGVVTVLSPWNYPLSMAVTDTLPALLAGNAVVQKPDTQTALTALWALELAHEAGLPEGVWSLLVGDPAEIGEPLLADANFVMFTGSTASGRRIAQEAGGRLIGTSLELGGKNAMLVLPDADLTRTVEGAIAACFPSTGQLCVAAERLYVHQDIHDQFVARFAARTRALNLGAGFDYQPEVGSLTNPNQLRTVAAHVADAVEKGATVLAGGRPRPDLGPLFYEPTILGGVTNQMIVFGTETFGPVVSIYPYTTLGDVVEEVNTSAYGLNASIWTRDGRRGRDLAARLHAGTVGINDPFTAAWGSTDAPMGGMGDSGLGRRHGAEGILKYTEAQTVSQQRLQGFAPPSWVSFDVWAKVMTRYLKALRALRVK